jgi:hypothetical protein
MKKKYNNYGKAMVVMILLAVAFGVFPLLGNAQENDPPLFELVECMKVKPEKEKVLVKSELWEVIDKAFAQ